MIKKDDDEHNELVEYLYSSEWLDSYEKLLIINISFLKNIIKKEPICLILEPIWEHILY